MTASPLPQDFDVVPNQRHPCPGFMKLNMDPHHLITLPPCTIESPGSADFIQIIFLSNDSEQAVFTLGLALSQEAMCNLAKSPPTILLRKLLEKAELVEPMGITSLFCTTRVLAFWPRITCLKTKLTA